MFLSSPRAVWSLFAVCMLSAWSALLLPACEEVAPPLIGATIVVDTTFVDPDLPPAQARIVLLEDFTGVRCVNCPQAHELAKDIANANPGLVVPVSEHNYFEGGFPNSDEDFRTDDAYAIDNLLGPTSLWPIGVVNRRLFPGEPAILLVLAKWTGYVDAELAEAPKVNVSMEATLDRTNRMVTVIVEAHFLETVTEDLRLSVMLNENGIIDPQQTQTGVVDDYVHNHVLRAMPTPSTGAVITSTTEAGRVIRRGYEIDIADIWNIEELEVVAFIHEGQTDRKAVLQTSYLELE
jgi:hypothetical protein